MNVEPIVLLLLLLGAGALGGGIGFALARTVTAQRARKAGSDAERILSEAQTKEKETLLKATEEALRVRNAAEAEARERRAELQRQERRVSRKEEQIDNRLEALDRREKAAAEKEKGLEGLRAEVAQLKDRQVQELERVAQLTAEQARELVLARLEDELKVEATRRVRQTEAEIRESIAERAREIVGSALQSYAGDVVSEMTTSVVSLPNDEMKGRLIGREGRNIRALENATGVNLIVDDTPGAVTLSAFDPVRREVARVAVTKLVQDGRIQPARIEEVVEKSQQEVEGIVRKAGEEAAFETGVHGLPAELINLLGRLKFRYSYGQNVLTHSTEMAHIGAVMAADLRASGDIVRRGALLHDIGKALSHEVEGPHAQIGAELASRYGLPPKVVNCIASHHGDVAPTCVEAFIVQAADAISGGRPGARRENAEAYVKRLETLEQIATGFEGVEKAYAIQAGREIRIMVKPASVDDLQATRIARDVAKRIEESLQYPGQIKVVVIRETRATDYAR